MVKKTDEKKQSKLLEILKTEYPFEGVLLGFLGILVLIIGVYIFEGQVLVIRLTSLWIFNTPTKITIFSIIVMVVGTGAIALAFSPFFIPGLKEMKRVTWPTRSLFLNHTARVLGFITFLGFMFVLYDSVLAPIFSWLYEIGF
ncbi:MAG: preprotein translocase subunit SecE [Candidatus Izemoplasmataceae bacterium]|jgi:preprotein translocase subunit SecE|uniref:preprotein translocase subunit SecE n=1 Tax=Liberiplasma polymorphum TaxID=3374570 RepID=UPI003772300C